MTSTAVSHSEGYSAPRLLLPMALLLAAATLLLYWPARNFEFVDFDDRAYLFKSPAMQEGLTPRGIAHCFTDFYLANWHPVTTLTYLVEKRVFGLENAGAFHLVDAAIHAINAGLMCVVLWVLTRSLWRSAFVAALFALHPLHVESVAWVAELKDVLSVFFMLLTIGAYAWYVNRPSGWRFLGVVILYALGLMSKPMLVTLPVLLLLLDFWPLKRSTRIKWLLLEKTPLMAMALASAIVTLLAQYQGGAVTPFTSNLAQRCASVPVAYAMYLLKMFWPTKLSVFYPMTALRPWWPGALAGLAVVTAVAIVLSRRRPCLVVGWAWFLISLIPVIGIVQVGQQSIADRYTYIPLIGVFIMITWTAADLLTRWRWREPVLATAATAVLIALALRTSVQIPCWQNDETLFRHALAVTANNPLAEFHIGEIDRRAGRLEDAIKRYRNAVWLMPSAPPVLTQLGLTLSDAGHHDEGIGVLAKAAVLADSQLAVMPGSSALRAISSGAHQNLGVVWKRMKDLGRAIQQYEIALGIEPRNQAAHHLLAIALVERGRVSEAVEHFRTAQRLCSGEPTTAFEAGATLESHGHGDDAIEFYRQTIALNPRSMAGNNLAWILATSRNDQVRNGREAVRLASESVRTITSDRAFPLDTLAAAYAEVGEFDKAVQTAQDAIRAAEQDKQLEIERDIRARIELYRQHKPYREPARAPATTPAP